MRLRVLISTGYFTGLECVSRWNRIDHVWLLQIDPNYTKRWLNLLNDGAWFRDPRIGSLKNCLQAADPIMEADSVLDWKNFVVIIEKLKGFSSSHASSSSKGQALLSDCDEALGAIVVLLQECMIRCSKSTAFVLRPKPFTNSLTEDPLHYCLSMLLAGPDEEYVLNRSILLRYLHDHSQNRSRYERARVDETLASMYSDWATLV